MLPQAWKRLAQAMGRRCHACGAVVHADAKTGPLPCLCETCRTALAQRRGGYCPGCGAIVPDASAPPSLCGQCRRSPRPWNRLHFYGPYTGQLRDLLRGFKFRQRLGLGRLLYGMAEAGYRGGPAPDVIVPVPLHRTRLVRRGFNQSQELARRLGHFLSCPVEPHALVRVRATAPQMSLPAKERMANVRGAFQARKELVHSRRVLLVDDIMTTGRTLEACAKSLRRAGVRSIEVLVLARTVLAADA